MVLRSTLDQFVKGQMGSRLLYNRKNNELSSYSNLVGSENLMEVGQKIFICGKKNFDS